MSVSSDQTSTYLQYLPEIYSEQQFLGRFLLAFEQILTGLEGAESEPKTGLEEEISQIYQLFSPTEIDKFFDSNNAQQQEILNDFLQWLASWVALSLRADWTQEQQQAFLANIVSLYRFRGTKKNLVELLQIYTGKEFEPRIIEPEDTPFQIGVNSTIGVNTQIEGSPPYSFKVEVTLPIPDRELLQRQADIILALVDLQKPAHTNYDLTIFYETIQIGNPERSTIGENMLIGNLKTFTNLEGNNG
ncbi:MAG: phage tail protein [Pleurocapsa sp. MO_226.B13]|nr:phage tail protein [Pleurocapsa sp. MO_226.B13]